ncbi:MAG: tetratricopeptide repeat protein, partial [Verrucomicrobiota bacterium]
MWTIGLIAATQLFAVIRAVMSRPELARVEMSEVVPIFPPPQPISTQPATAAGSAPGAGSPDRLVPEAGSTGLNVSLSAETRSMETVPLAPQEMAGSDLSPLDAVNPMPHPTFIGPHETAGPTLSESLSAAAFDAEKIEDPILERLVSAGEELRATGNMPGALQALREAESALPEHPRVLGELAATFSQMGRDEKATVYWEKILSLGSVRGGAYYELANRQLRGEQPLSAGAAGQIMSVGQVEVTEEAPGEEGQRVSLRIVVDADPASNPTGSDMALLVY